MGAASSKITVGEGLMSGLKRERGGTGFPSRQRSIFPDSMLIKEAVFQMMLFVATCGI